MSRNSTRRSSNFEHGNLKPGVYRIQNLYSETYLDIRELTRELCCRPFRDLEPRKGLWHIEPFGSGYVVQRIDPSGPEQYCTQKQGVGDGTPLCVAPYPVAWRIEVAAEEQYRGFEYVRFFWGNTKMAWDLDGGGKDDGRKVQSYLDRWHRAWRIWKLIPVNVAGVELEDMPIYSWSPFGTGAPPSYFGSTGKSKWD